jgi:hypothetical protein
MTELLSKALAQLSQLPEAKQNEIASLILFEVELLEDGVEETPVEELDDVVPPFVGMWSDRIDLADSTRFVRQLRQTEWQ